MRILRISVILLLSAQFLLANEEPIGYIGFINEGEWRIQFNDCTINSFDEAEKFLWFNRNLESISCYAFYNKSNVLTNSKHKNLSLLMKKLIIFYSSPNKFDKAYESYSFRDLTISKKGWGSFPKVYSRSGANWYKMKEGWIYIENQDKKYIQFYEGQQEFNP